jgi:hypothetical protein
MRDIEGLGGPVNVGRDHTAGKGNDETGERDNHSAVPFVGLRPVLWVLRIIDFECDQLPVLYLAGSRRSDWLDDLSRRSLRGVLFHVRIVGDLAEGKVQGVDLALASSQGEPPHGMLMVLLIRHVELCTSDTQGS